MAGSLFSHPLIRTNSFQTCRARTRPTWVSEIAKVGGALSSHDPHSMPQETYPGLHGASCAVIDLRRQGSACTSTFSKVSFRAATQLRLSCLEFPLRLLP